MTTPTIIDAARRITAQLDKRGNPDLTGLPETLCRALKVQEEAGEMAQAVIGVLGQNPRKGITHNWDDVVAEAIDVVMSALVFAETVTREHLEYALADRLAGRLDHLARRAAASGAPDVEQVAETAGPGADPGRQRQAATLRWLLDVHTEHGLPLPEDFIGYTGGGTLRLRLADDQADGVTRWAAYLGLPVECREVDYSGSHWVNVKAEQPWDGEVTDVTGLGWKHVEIVTNCDRRQAPAEAAAPVAVAA
ncbi:MazG-like family protein [Actinoplanes subtropicus]|uniref:MazG-like family protein n=1 Tax=Actinoplanes subtropicus TaxID=543632 RepID=UPI000690C2ED|nr:MazG-like family protein [Actinoplanes subtropicus]